ncbi:hypothetical protein AX16_008243 [Volvariella volvacea WC 439]|nr:hypothetical protein AX16_008243 [Volvariella volvacea WC 439]
MFLAGMFLAAFARALASPTPVTIPSSPIPSPLCVVTAALSAGTCDPNRKRTIFDILYSCLGVIFLCTYISIHHNVPDQTDSWGKKTWLKVRTMLYAMVAPEIVIMWALRQRITAGGIAERRKDKGWTTTHGFFVQMGGLMLKGEGTGNYTVVQLKFIGSRPEIYAGDDEVKEMPRIRKKEIQDRGKGDVLAKAIVILQTSWFVAQCIARRVEDLVLTELELVTLAFAALNVVTYILWWDKPLNVEYPIYFDKQGNRVDGPEEKEEEALPRRLWKAVTGARTRESGGEDVALLGDDQEGIGAMKTTWLQAMKKPFSAVFGPLLEMTNVEETHRTTSVHSFYAAPLNAEQHRLAYQCASVIGVIFGGIHLIGWNFAFLTTTELWLWRASSLVLTITPVFIPLSWQVLCGWYTGPSMIDRLFAFLITRIGAPVYIIARIFILFLAFFALRDLPDSAYENIKWSNFIPHI